ncbi:MAG: hypothetical protein JNJ72_19295 [Anaerolineales bacterium]|jgi:hypothetical protein|nr:hypothetical protein [Anaerolineales bacterium]HNQ96202.1 hypothetical protein [Anaerolineales bacterium]
MSALFNYYLPITALRVLPLPKLIIRRFDLLHFARHDEHRPFADVRHVVENERHPSLPVINGTRAGEETRLLCAEERMKLFPDRRLLLCNLNLLAQEGTPRLKCIGDENHDEH